MLYSDNPRISINGTQDRRLNQYLYKEQINLDMAIKVIKENPVPRQQITCESCGSILEYGNADLQPLTIYSNGYATSYKIICPVCGVYVKCDWIKR